MFVYRENPKESILKTPRFNNNKVAGNVMFYDITYSLEFALVFCNVLNSFFPFSLVNYYVNSSGPKLVSGVCCALLHCNYLFLCHSPFLGSGQFQGREQGLLVLNPEGLIIKHKTGLNKCL